MAQDSRIKPKEWLLLFFVAICTLLVVVIWWEGIFADGDNTADFIRPTANFEIDEDAYENWNITEEPASLTPSPALTTTATP